MGTCLRNLFLFSLIFAICFILQSSSASISPKQRQHFPSAMVEGSVYCNTCFQQDFPKFGYFIPGALVAVKCVEGIGQNKLRFQKKVKTNEHGVFRFRLPLELSRNLEALKTCSVKLVRSSQSFCSMASSSETSSGLRLKSRRHGARVFSAGFFAFKPPKQPDACNHEPILSTTAKYSLLSRKRVRPALFFPPPIPFLPPPSIPFLPSPPIPFLPPPSIPFLPSPPIPFLPPPSIPFLPSPPIPFLPSPPNVGGIPLPPNPLQPPPSILPPLPFQPPPPPFIGIPPLPNIPPFPNIPSLPYLVPPPPPPPPALFPPLPFPPMFPPSPFPPIFPGNPPPAASARRTIP